MLDANMFRFIFNEPKLAPKIVGRLGQVGPENIALSAIVAQELAVCVRNTKLPRAERDDIAHVLHYFPLLAFDDRAAHHAAEVESELGKIGAKNGKADMLIAGHARGLGMTVVSNNTKHFCQVKGLPLEDWSI